MTEPQIEAGYLEMARELMGKNDVNEIASALMVRDYACALVVKAMKLREEPEDSDVCYFLENVVPVQSEIA